MLASNEKVSPSTGEDQITKKCSPSGRYEGGGGRETHAGHGVSQQSESSAKPSSRPLIQKLLSKGEKILMPPCHGQGKRTDIWPPQRSTMRLKYPEEGVSPDTGSCEDYGCCRFQAARSMRTRAALRATDPPRIGRRAMIMFCRQKSSSRDGGNEKAMTHFQLLKKHAQKTLFRWRSFVQNAVHPGYGGTAAVGR